MVEQKITEWLDSHNIKYIVISFSLSYVPQEVAISEYALEGDLIHAVLVRIEREKIAMAVVPATRKASLTSLQEVLGTTKVEFVNKHDAKSMFHDCETGTIPPLGNLFNMEVFFSEELYAKEEVTFHTGAYRRRIRMKYKDFERLVRPNEEIIFSTTARYWAEISTVAPKVARESLKDYKDCFLGVSLQNTNFVPPKLIGITDWISLNFEKCTAMVADSIHRITLQINEGLSESRASHRALHLGREFIDKNEHIFHRHANFCHFEFILASEIQMWKEYEQYYAQVQRFAQEDQGFAVSVSQFADIFIRRRFNKSIPEDSARYVELSTQYLLEEMAIFICLMKRGIPVFVYPGSLSVFSEIAEGEHPAAPDALKELVNVSLRLKKRRR